MPWMVFTFWLLIGGPRPQAELAAA